MPRLWHQKKRALLFFKNTLPFESFNLNFMEHYLEFLLADVLVIDWVFEQWVRFGAARFSRSFIISIQNDALIFQRLNDL